MSSSSRTAMFATAAASLVVFVLFGVLATVAWPALRHVDAFAPAAGHALATHSTAVRIAALTITDLGSPVAADVVAVAAFAYFAFQRRWRPAIAVAVARLGELACETVAKVVVDRPRPGLLPQLTSASDSSFPSGHSAGSAATYGVVALLLAADLPARAARWTVVLTSVFVVLVGTSRIMLGVHFPTDVLAGFALGIAWAVAAVAGARVRSPDS